jgi:hypothetical protein
MNRKREPSLAFAWWRLTGQSRPAAGAVSVGPFKCLGMAKTLLAKSVVRSALMALAAGLCCTPLAGAPDPYTSELERSPVPDYYQREKNQRIAREQQEHYRLRVAIADAVGQDVPTAEAARRASRQSATTAPKPPAATWLEADRTVLLVIVLIVLAGCFLVRKYARGLLEALNEAFNPWVVTEPAAAGLLRTRVRAEEEGLSEFLAAFRAGPIAADLADSGNATLELPSVQAERLKAFYEKSGKTLETQRQLLQEADRSTDEGGRLKLLLALRWEMHALRGEAGLRELLPIWQMAFALEGLL